MMSTYVDAGSWEVKGHKTTSVVNWYNINKNLIELKIELMSSGSKEILTVPKGPLARIVFSSFTHKIIHGKPGCTISAPLLSDKIYIFTQSKTIRTANQRVWNLHLFCVFSEL